MAQLTNMARNGTVPQDLAAAVCSIVDTMKTSAKLEGLGTLIDQLKKQNPERWRMVVFTGAAARRRPPFRPFSKSAG